MLKIDKVRAKQHAIFIVIDYFWGGFSGFAVVFLILAIWQVGSEFSSPLLLPPPKDVFLKFPAEKQEKILSVIETEFKTKPCQKVNVKEIIEKSGLTKS